MTHQPFKSAPVFNSFPDLDEPGPSIPQHKSYGTNTDDAKRKHKKDRSKRSDDKKTRDRHRDSKGLRRVEDAPRSSGSTVYFRDTKGDELNVTYGYLDAKDVPKYREIAGKHFHVFLQ